MRVEDAKEYIGYCIKEGYAEPEDFAGWSDEELIKYAEYNMERADNFYDQIREDND